MAIKVMCDVGSNLYQQLLEDKGLDIKVLPMTLTIKDKNYLCYKDIDDVPSFSKEFYTQMREGVIPKTTLPSPGLLAEEIKKEVTGGNEVIVVTLSKNISGTYQSAKLIAGEINEEEKRECVYVIDSLTAGFGEGLIAIKAHNLAKEGKSFEEVIKLTEEYVQTVRSEFTVDDLKFLAQNGRISALAARFANALSIKPLLFGSPEGEIKVTAKIHGRKKALIELVNQIVLNIDHPNEQTIYISHCDALEEANQIKDRLIEDGITNVEVYYYDLVTGAHVGPGTIAVFYEGNNREINVNHEGLGERIKQRIEEIKSSIKKEKNPSKK